MNLLPLGAMLVLLALNVPVALAIAMATLVFFLQGAGPPVDIFIQRFVASTDSFPLLAVPLFILAGTIMNYAGIARRLLALAEALVGHWTGGLAQANIVFAALMGGPSASANADAAMQTKMVGGEMTRRGYPPAFTAALVACASVIAPIIPPGIGLIVYAFLADVSVGRIFIGGILPGLLLTVALMAAAAFVARRRGYRPERARFVGGAELWRVFKEALWSLTIPIFILVGIRYGIFTPTEAGAITVVYTVLVGMFAYRTLRLADLPRILRETSLDTASVMLMICAASAFGFYLAWERLPPKMAEWLVTLTSDPTALLLLLNAMLIVLGTAIEGTSALIILTPILIPVIVKLGIDPVHFGIVLVANLTIAGVTPPVGQMMFISSQVLKVPMNKYSVEVMPFLGAMMGVLLLLTLFPQLSTWLPNLMYGK